MGIVITIMSGVEDGKIIEPRKIPFTLGRHPEDDVCLPYDTRVSRHHARITKEGKAYFIEDIGPEEKGSTNGTFINEKRVISKTPLSTGDMILLGSVWVKFEVRHKAQGI